MKRNLRLATFVVAALLVASSVLSLGLAHRSLAAQNEATLVPGFRAYAQDIDKLLRRYDKLELDPASTENQVQQTGRLFLPTSEGGFEIALTPHDMRAERYRAQETLDGGIVRELERGQVRTYKGSVAGIPGAQARFTIDKNTFEGLVITPGQIYFIEPAKRYSASASSSDFVLYKQSDLIQTSFGECGVMLAEKVGSEAAKVQSFTSGLTPGQSTAEELFTPPRTDDLATEADLEYFTT